MPDHEDDNEVRSKYKHCNPIGQIRIHQKSSLLVTKVTFPVLTPL